MEKGRLTECLEELATLRLRHETEAYVVSSL
jgi:hypothetical protein